MITREIGGRQALPLRGLPFATGGALDGLVLAEFLVDEKMRALYPPLQPFTCDTHGQINQLGPEAFSRMAAEMRSARGDTREQHRARIPAGIWVWVDDVRRLFTAMATDFMDPHTRKVPPEFGAWSSAPTMTEAESDFIFEGGRTRSQPTAASGRGKLLKNGVDPNLKEAAVRIARGLASQFRRSPSRVKVAQALAKELDEKPATIERRIRAEWWP